MWEQLSVYHIDRLDALVEAFGNRYNVVAIEVATKSEKYAWKPVISNRFRRVTLFPGKIAEEVSWARKLVRSLRAILQSRPVAILLCNQDQPEILVANLILRTLRFRTFAMVDAKFDDSPRNVFKEALKWPVLRLYCGAIVAGSRSASYYKFLGMPRSWTTMAYDTISLARIRIQAATSLAPAGICHSERDFIVVARFVPKKNLPLVIRAFAAYRARGSRHERFRKLIFCGSGQLEHELRALALELSVSEFVVFKGFLDAEQIAKELGASLALIIPSVEEQWGLVVNEAVALGIPVLCSVNVGARDSLVRVGINGFVFESDNYQGLAMLMHLLSENSSLWEELSRGSHQLAPLGDVEHFVYGVQRMLGFHTKC